MKASLIALASSIGLSSAAPVEARDGGSGEIVGGTAVSSATTYPFIANMRKSGSFICDGTILSPTKILTAAHCAVDGSASQFSFRVGTLTYNSGGTVVSASKKAVHPKYNAGTTDYDVAVITLAQPLTFSSTIAAANIVGAGSTPAAGRSTTVIGWGATSDGGSVSSRLLQVTVPVVSRTTCNSEYQGGITSRMFCAAANGKDSCNGDSGGPIFDTSSKVLLGGVSFGNGCAQPGYAGVYADYSNSELNSWIKSQL